MSLQGQGQDQKSLQFPPSSLNGPQNREKSTAKVAEYLENNNNDSAIDRVLCNKVVIVLGKQFIAVYTLLC